MNPYYKDYSAYLGEIFPGVKVQKISVNAGFSCPNRDGTIGSGGCIYCNNASFSPGYCMEGDNSVASQLAKGKAFFARKYPQMKYLAYFQSFTNTHGRSISDLEFMYRQALESDGVVGIVVGTRPDTFGHDVVSLLKDIAGDVPVFVEFGAESSFDDTLAFINRGHTWSDTAAATERSAAAGLHVGLHLIAGLPGEDADRVLSTVDRCCHLPVGSLKFHQLQVIRNTPLAQMWKNKKIDLPITLPEQYMELCCRIIERVPRHIAIERFLASAPPEMVIAPRWGMKNHVFTDRLMRMLAARNVR